MRISASRNANASSSSADKKMSPVEFEAALRNLYGAFDVSDLVNQKRKEFADGIFDMCDKVHNCQLNSWMTQPINGLFWVISETYLPYVLFKFTEWFLHWSLFCFSFPSSFSSGENGISLRRRVCNGIYNRTKFRSSSPQRNSASPLRFSTDLCQREWGEWDVRSRLSLPTGDATPHQSLS